MSLGAALAFPPRASAAMMALPPCVVVSMPSVSRLRVDDRRQRRSNSESSRTHLTTTTATRPESRWRNDDEQYFEWPFGDDDLSVVAQGGGENSGQQPRFGEDLVLRLIQYKGQSFRDGTQRESRYYFWASEHKKQEKCFNQYIE